MDSSQLSDNSMLSQLFNLPPESYRNIFQQIPNIYQQDPIAFGKTFMNELPNMDPKTVRIICYQLYINGITFDQFIFEIPEFIKSLDTFPLESISTLLKYRFPTIINGDLFFHPSLNRVTIQSYSSSYNWFDYILDICIHQKINLNHINETTQSTCLHSAIRMASLPLVQKLLNHRVDPNISSLNGARPLFVAIESLFIVDTHTLRVIYFNIIRQLRRYGAIIDDVVREQINMSPYQNQVQQILSNALNIEPIYDSTHDLYFSCDPIEDQVLIAELNPSVMNDELFPNTSIPFQNAIQKQRSKTLTLDHSIITWPYYIDDTPTNNQQQCSLSLDRRTSTASPPNPDQVYQSALKSLDNIQSDSTFSNDSDIDIIFLTDTPAYHQIPPTLSSIPTSPLPSGPILPTLYPLLPSI